MLTQLYRSDVSVILRFDVSQDMSTAPSTRGFKSRQPHHQRQKEEVEMFDTTESVITDGTTRVIDSMYERAKQFPVADHDEAVATLVEAAGETATLVDVLLMLASVTSDGDMHGALVDCSKKASSATMNTIRAVRFIARKA